MVSLVCKFDILEGLGHHCLFFVRRDSLYSRVENEMFFDCHVLPEDVKLRTVPYLELDGFKLVLDVEPSDPRISFGWRIKACEH
jgi:hypothetical protein